jgi:hypothetical protein
VVGLQHPGQGVRDGDHGVRRREVLAFVGQVRRQPTGVVAPGRGTGQVLVRVPDEFHVPAAAGRPGADPEHPEVVRVDQIRGQLVDHRAERPLVVPQPRFEPPPGPVAEPAPPVADPEPVDRTAEQPRAGRDAPRPGRAAHREQPDLRRTDLPPLLGRGGGAAQQGDVPARVGRRARGLLDAGVADDAVVHEHDDFHVFSSVAGGEAVG